jgi:hypothetical protein
VCNQLMDARYLEGVRAWEVSRYNRECVREGRQFPVCTVVPVLLHYRTTEPKRMDRVEGT